MLRFSSPPDSACSRFGDGLRLGLLQVRELVSRSEIALHPCLQSDIEDYVVTNPRTGATAQECKQQIDNLCHSPVITKFPRSSMSGIVFVCCRTAGSPKKCFSSRCKLACPKTWREYPSRRDRAEEMKLTFWLEWGIPIFNWELQTGT